MDLSTNELGYGNNVVYKPNVLFEVTNGTSW